MSDRLNGISAFVEVARRRSFVRAAEHLGVNVSAVSRAVAALETRLGARLLQRTTRSVALSEAGRSHFTRCEALLAELDDAEAAVSEHGSALLGSLRVSAPSGFGLTHLTPMLPEFLREHPQLQLDLQMSNRFVDLIEEGYDLAIRVGTLRDSRLVARRLGNSQRILVAAPEYLKRSERLRHPRELGEHACLVLDIGTHPEIWQLVRKSARQNIRVAGPLRSNQVLALRDVCLRGMGLALLPEFSIAADLRRGTLVRVLPEWSSVNQGIYALYPTHRFIPTKVRAFVDFIAARLHGE